MVKITERKTKIDWAYFLEEIAAQYKSAEKITLVMDNLNTHTTIEDVRKRGGCVARIQKQQKCEGQLAFYN